MLNPRFAISPILVEPSLRDVRGRLVCSAPDNEDCFAVVVELNLRPGVPPRQVESTFEELFHSVVSDDEGRTPYRIADGYLRCTLTEEEASRLVVADWDSGETPPSIFRIWPDYVMYGHADRSCTTIKADASRRAYAATGAGIVWAVLDTGIDGDHPHFSDGTLADESVNALHRDFTWLVRGEPAPDPVPRDSALVDESGHGTHVSGIIAGGVPDSHVPVIACLRPATGNPALEDSQWPQWEQRATAAGATMSGMAPLTRLVSLKVLDAQTDAEMPRTTSSAVIAALAYLREVNAWGRSIQIHGANLSLGCDWHPRDYAAGQSPLCRELNLLVGTGVVAVVSAGNSGAASSVELGESGDNSTRGVTSSITEPGHAEDVITVGATHRDRPHTYGVWYQSAKGPTLDGRRKPDLVAPGENISSAASGRMRAAIPEDVWLAAAEGQDCAADQVATYADDSGTSMAAPHVSGAIAAFLSVRKEFIGYPDRVKRIFCDSAVSLGRDANFEGHGLVDVMAAISSV